MEDTVRKRRSYQRRWVKAKRLKLKQGTYSTSDNTDSHEEESSFADSMEGSSSVIAAVPVLESEESLSQLSSSTDNEADEISDDEDRGVIFRNRLAVWASECNITQGNTERLLRLMKDFKETDVFKDLPKTARTLQSSLRSVDLGCKSSMQYYYLGLRNELGKVIQSLPIIGFSSVGGDNIGQTVRFILKKVASAGVWSCYSRVGKNAKEAFSDLALDKIIYRACKKIYGRTFSEKDYIRVVGEALRHFPSQKGGSRWKGVEKEKTESLSSSEDETIQLLTLHS